MKSLDRIKSDPRVESVDDERNIGNGIIVTLKEGNYFYDDCGVIGADSLSELQAEMKRIKSTNIVHRFKPKNKTEKEIWTALVTGQEVFISRDFGHSHRRRMAINKIRDAGVELLRTDKAWNTQYSYVLPALTKGDCIVNRIIADAPDQHA